LDFSWLVAAGAIDRSCALVGSSWQVGGIQTFITGQEEEEEQKEDS
jgi:hypothetical protein